MGALSAARAHAPCKRCKAVRLGFFRSWSESVAIVALSASSAAPLVIDISHRRRSATISTSDGAGKATCWQPLASGCCCGSESPPFVHPSIPSGVCRLRRGRRPTANLNLQMELPGRKHTLPQQLNSEHRRSIAPLHFLGLPPFDLRCITSSSLSLVLVQAEMGALTCC